MTGAGKMMPAVRTIGILGPNPERTVATVPLRLEAVEEATVTAVPLSAGRDSP
jgi:hypothetical protein